MDTAELPLVIFTILAQMSVGCFVVLGVVHLANRRHGDEAVDRLSDPALYAIGPVMVAALIASLFHLGNPINALHSIGNLGSSWLSREIFFGSAFTAMGAAFALFQWRKWFTPLLRQLLAALTAVVGLALVYSMSMVYLLPTVPGWDSWATPLSFFTTTFLLGIFAVGAAFVTVTVLNRRKAVTAADSNPNPDTTLLHRSLKGIAVAAIVLLGVEFVVLPTYALGLATGSGAEAETASALLAAGGSVFILRLVMVFFGAGLLGIFLYRFATSGRDQLMVYTAATAFALVLVSEIIGRVLFYSSFARIGL